GDPHRVLVGGDSEPFRLRGADGPELFEMPVERVSARNEGSIVLEELPERDQDLPEVDDPPDPRTKLLGPGEIMHRRDRPVIELDDRALDGVADPHRG